ncbi:MAG: GAF domain-containing protein [Acidimicrobiia bacterium]|nr:GAF domain-containing protein [Acidimicrobiia bacterium]
MTTFRVRAVPIGVLATVLAVVALAVFPFVGGSPDIDAGPYAVIVAVAVVGVVFVALLPWRRLLASSVGDYAFYVWSAFDIVLIAIAAAASGGGRSPVVLLYFATTLFFVSSYPRLGQAALLLFTFAAWLTMLALTGESPGSGVLVVQFASLGVVAFLGSFLSGELMQQMRALGTARSESQRRAKLLATVAGAASSINVLDPDEVLGHVVDAVVELGFDAANLCLLQDGGTSYRVVHGRGLPDNYEHGVHPATMGMVALVRQAGATVVVNDYAADPRGVPQLRDLGFRAVAATPIWGDGEELTAVLVGGTRSQREISPEELEAFQLLGRLAEGSLANVRRYEHERLAVSRLAELDDMKREFIANVSHELRTPLTVIQGMGKTLASRWTEMPEETRSELLMRVNRNADALAATINTLLDFSQLEAGRLELRAEPFDLGELVRRSVDRLASLFGQRRVVVATDEGLYVTADPRLIERVLDNLLSNAAKHTLDDARVTVRASPLDGTGEARVSVSDDGPGIAPADLEHLGERFYRGSDVVARRTRGAGLGLAFARQVVELHGERLEIESEPGRGSTFAFNLPLVGENDLNLTPA